ncbi:MAG: hypothetical protein Q8R36_00320 [bacterium]|nr:hypothetical protein [bacterium]
MNEKPPNQGNIVGKPSVERRSLRRIIEEFNIGLSEIKTLEDFLVFIGNKLVGKDLKIASYLLGAFLDRKLDPKSQRNFFTVLGYKDNIKNLPPELSKAIHDKLVEIVGTPEESGPSKL